MNNSSPEPNHRGGRRPVDNRDHNHPIRLHCCCTYAGAVMLSRCPGCEFHNPPRPAPLLSDPGRPLPARRYDLIALTLLLVAIAVGICVILSIG